MGRHADHIVCLYKLDVSVLAQLIGQAKQAKLWRALSSVSYKFEAHNCASIVLSVLLQPICPSDQSLQSMDDNQEALAYANDSIFPTQDRKEYLKGITTNSGSVVKRWKKDIEQERSFEPFPKIDLDKVPPFVTPGFVNLWVRNLSALERNQSFVLRWITPPYREKVEVKPMNYSARASEKDRSYWSWRLPIASFIRTYVPGYRSYIGEHIIWDAGLFLLTGIAASKNPDSKTTKTLVVSFLYSISNSLRTLIFRQFYGRTRRLESHAS
jgi:hypothetical protein